MPDKFLECDFSPVCCQVNTGAIARNFHKLGAPQNLMPVIKSDAYGHGLFSVAKALDEAGAAYFAVGTVSEGVALRKRGFKQIIIPLLGCLTNEERQEAIANNLTPLIRSFEDLKEFVLPGKPLGIALKFDTGMSRLGFSANNLGEILEILGNAPHIRPMLAISHLACADMPGESNFTQNQAKIFFEIAKSLQANFPSLRTSLGNSAACGTTLAGDITRAGIALYGGNPFWGTDRPFPALEWAMSVKAPVIQLRQIKAGTSISYGRTYQAEKDLSIAIIAAGYANGLNRNLSGKMSLLANGRRIRQIGRICMGMLMADINDHPDIQAGQDVWILGGGKGDIAPNAQEMATLLNTIPYEIMCLLGSLNRREYV